jgi:hypothetical protein
MPIITKPSSIQKNSPAEISLDKSALAAVTSVAANPYYSDSANWKEVFIYYKSSVGNQREVLKFNATISSPVATFLVSEKARDIFEVQKIVIVDFDNGSITVPRSQLTVAEFDVDMGVIGSPDPVTFELFQNYPIYSPSVDPTTLTRTSNDPNSSPSIALSNQSLGSLSGGVGNFDVTFNLDNLIDTLGLHPQKLGVEIGILFSNSDSNTIGLSDISNWENSSYALIADFRAGMPTKIIGTDGWLGSAGLASATKSLRFLQEGNNQLKIYQDGSLINTITVANVSKPYAYPFFRSYFQHTLTSAEAIIG